jgi:hypothetical protein
MEDEGHEPAGTKGLPKDTTCISCGCAVPDILKLSELAPATMPALLVAVVAHVALRQNLAPTSMGRN